MEDPVAPSPKSQLQLWTHPSASDDEDPSNVQVSPVHVVENEAVGARLSAGKTVSACAPLTPALSVTVSVTTCGPGSAYVWLGAGPEVVVPSPKSHENADTAAPRS